MRSATSIVRAAFCSTSRIVDAFLLQLLEDLEHLVDDQRREPERRLVEEQQLRPREQRARDRELLLLAARELRARPVVVTARAPRSARTCCLMSASASRAVLAAEVPICEVLADGEPAEDAPVLRNERDARAAGSASGERPPIDLPWKVIWPELGLSTPVIAHSVVDLPAPLWPTRPTSSPSLTSSESLLTAAIRP